MGVGVHQLDAASGHPPLAWGVSVSPLFGCRRLGVRVSDVLLHLTVGVMTSSGRRHCGMPTSGSPKSLSISVLVMGEIAPYCGMVCSAVHTVQVGSMWKIQGLLSY